MSTINHVLDKFVNRSTIHEKKNNRLSGIEPGSLGHKPMILANEVQGFSFQIQHLYAKNLEKSVDQFLKKILHILNQ